MSFVVSFNGQFKPYNLPDLSHYDKVHHVYRPLKDTAIDQDTEFLKHLGETPLKKQKQRNTAIGNYQKQEKQHEKEHIPHHANDIMSKNLKLITTDSSFAEIKNLMDKYNLHHLPVINEEEVLTGMISDRDLLKFPNTTNLKAKDFMTSEVLTCFETTRIQEISKIMLHEKISAIPIINHNYELVGIVTKTDILRFLTRILSINQLI